MWTNNELKNLILEDKRNELVRKSKSSDQYTRDKSKGKNRFERRLKSKVAPSTRQYNSIDMNKLFKDGELDVSIEVRGETSTYLVKVRMEMFLEALHAEMYKRDGVFDRQAVMKALVSILNSEDIYVSCSCPDFKYRIAYYATQNGTNSGPDEIRPSDVTNPDDTKGPGCKHIMLVLNNNGWLTKVASVIYNYVNYMKEHKENLYGKKIYPAIYGKKYDKDAQIAIGDEDENKQLDTDTDEIDRANQNARKRGQFKTGNDFRFKKGPTGDANQIEFDLNQDSTNEQK